MTTISYMIYTDNTTEYKVKFYEDPKTEKSPVLEYIESLSEKEQAKVFKYIEFLRINKGYLEEPYSRHIKEKVRELRVDFARKRYRIFYFVFVKRTIILLHAFLKKTAKTSISETKRAEENYYNVLKNPETYE